MMFWLKVEQTLYYWAILPVEKDGLKIVELVKNGATYGLKTVHLQKHIYSASMPQARLIFLLRSNYMLIVV